jgi:periplasmic protein CpxP/Spy
MKSAQKFFAAALLASLGLAASAQTPNAPQTGAGTPPAAGEIRHDPARMQERMTQRLADLKQKLQITPGQEGAWTAYTSALQPTQMQRPNRDELAQLTTPERIDRMRQLRTQRMAEMDQRGEATKTFYAALTPEQKKVFDAQTLRGPWSQSGHGHHHRHHG